jgi:hypothetical protein
MDFSITYNFITGMMLGIEFVTDEEEGAKHMVLDLLILRLMFSAYTIDE